MSLHSQGSVFKADILVSTDKERIEAWSPSADAVLKHLLELSAQRKVSGLPYLTWVASPVKFGFLADDEPKIQRGLNLSTQTHPEFHKGMAHDEFTFLVQLYAEHLAAFAGSEFVYVNYLGQHSLAVYQIDPTAIGRTSA